jgi:hypothetical protein
MIEHCEACGAEINDSTIICKCGCNIQAQRLTRQIEILESANNGWRNSYARLCDLCGRLAEALVAEHGDQYTANEICECDICNLIAEGRKARDGG